MGQHLPTSLLQTLPLKSLFNSTNGSGGAGARFSGGGNATAVVQTNGDSSIQLVVDVNGDGAFTSADFAAIITGATGTIATSNFV